MEYLTLDEIKQQLIIDQSFTDDDTYLTALGDTAEAMVAKQLDKTLEDVVSENDGELPATLKHAMLLLIEYFYDNRGSGDNQIPDAFFYICSMYRNYAWMNIPRN